MQFYYGCARRDPFGRALAQVRIAGGGWVEGQMLRASEAQARIAHRGLWRPGGAYQVRLPLEVDRSTTGFRLLEGRIAKVAVTGASVYLDFAGDGGFAAQAPKAAVLDLTEAGLAPARLAARLIRVRGVVGWNGIMRIDHPEQIEVVDGK